MSCFFEVCMPTAIRICFWQYQYAKFSRRDVWTFYIYNHSILYDLTFDYIRKFAIFCSAVEELEYISNSIKVPIFFLSLQSGAGKLNPRQTSSSLAWQKLSSL